jgi:Xaa-Pro aminopeptidase
LIDANMLTRKEKNWLNAYHQAVYSKLSPILAGPIIHWLAQATAEI